MPKENNTEMKLMSKGDLLFRENPWISLCISCCAKLLPAASTINCT